MSVFFSDNAYRLWKGTEVMHVHNKVRSITIVSGSSEEEELLRGLVFARDFVNCSDVYTHDRAEVAQKEHALKVLDRFISALWSHDI